jgi:hypothetical protein
MSKCNNSLSCSICHGCPHSTDHAEPLGVWKEPGKICTQEHVCEGTAKRVKCTDGETEKK